MDNKMVEIIRNPSAERNILSIILRNIDNLVMCSAQELYSEHFGVEANQIIYSIICFLAEQGVKHFDSNLIYSQMTNPSSIEIVDNIGGRLYIDSLLSVPINEDNLLIYVKTVKENHLKRMIFDFGKGIQEKVVDEEDVPKLLNELQAQILNLSLESNSKTEVYKFGSNAMERLRERMENPSETRGFKIGWSEFDKITQGFAPNDLVILVAPSKTGKSTWLLNVNDALSVKSNLKGLYIDTEMTDEEQEDRMISMISGVPYEEIQNGMFGQDTPFGTGASKSNKVFEATNLLNSKNSYHVYMPDFTIDKVSALIRKYKIQYDIDYAIFDYIKLPGSDVNSLNSAQEYQRLGYFTSCLKDMAGICNIPIISACQSNRNDLDTTDPDASNIGGSYRILQLATKLLFLRNKTPNELESEGRVMGNQKLHIKYQRNGEGDKAVDVWFERPILRMSEVNV